MGEREERQRDVRAGIEIEGGARVGNIGRHIVVREHHALGLAGGAGGVDDRAELAGEHLRGAHAVGGDFGAARGSDQRFVTQALGGHVGAAIGDDDVLELRQLRAAGQKLFQLLRAGHDDHARAGMLEDVGHAVRRLVEINGNGDAAGAVDGEIGGVPLGAIGGEEGYGIAGLDTQLDQRRGETRYAAEQLGGRDGLPCAIAAHHLRALVGARIDAVQESRGKRSVSHGVRSLYLREFGGAMRSVV